MKIKLRPFLPYILIAFAGLALLPLFGSKYLCTLDGAAHVYNAQLMNESLFHSESLAATNFQWNTFPVPNISGHIALQLLLLIFPIFLAEKVFVALLILLLPFTAWKLIRRTGGNELLAFYFIPFSFSQFIAMGFYNFVCAVIVLFFLIAYSIRSENRKTGLGYIIGLTVLWGILYFSHLLVFFIGIGIIGIYWLTIIFPTKDSFRSTARSLVKYLLPVIPFFVLGCLFTMRQHSDQLAHLSADALLGIIGRMDILVAYGNDERDISVIFAVILLIFFLISSYVFLKQQKLTPVQRFFLLSFAFVSVLIFILPDSSSESGYVSIRLIFLSTLLLLFLLSKFELKKVAAWMLIPLFGIHLVWCVRHFNFNKKFGNDALQLEQLGNRIPSRSTVAFIDLRTTNERHWIKQHEYCRLIQHPNVLLFNNYEADQSYFPLTWPKRTKERVYTAFHPQKTPDQIIRLLNPDFVVIASSTSDHRMLQLSDGYVSLQTIGRYTLYRKHTVARISHSGH